MSSYYREHVSYPNVTAGPYPPQLASDLDNIGSNITNVHHTPGGLPHDGPNARHCSVKGCSAPLPHDYPHKMCDECRGRHRVYAMTKRAKRKMEKALLNGSSHSGQPVVWMPPDAAQEEEEEEEEAIHPSELMAGPSRGYEPPQVSQVEDENALHFDFSSQTWDPRSLDLRVFSQTSELAGALTLPPAPHRIGEHVLYSRNDHQPQQLSQQLRSPSTVAFPSGPPPPPPAPEIHPVLAEVLKAVPGLNLPTRVTSGPTVPVSASTSSVDGPLPPRFCSIKGCKTLIAGNSFFKMCEPCRDRYRNYGTTKRAKWKREKEVAVAELHKLRTEEDARRVAQGLPPLPPDTDPWHEYSPPATSTPLPEVGPSSSTPRAASELAVDPGVEDAAASPPRPPRMCTVSHCREILPGDYRYLRCERHRIQNRHHSKLKRVRDKEVKAQVYDGWAAAVGARAVSTTSTEDLAGDNDATASAEVSADAAASIRVSVTANDIALAFEELEELRDESLDPEFAGVVGEAGMGLGAEEDMEETPLGEPSSGLPPAARGTRRTNHVCSIKACSNLLSPSNPWKMCDLCRSRDRAGRRLKALRDSGLIPPEVAAGKIVEVKMEVEGREEKDREKSERRERAKAKKKKKKAKKGADGEAVAGGTPGADAPVVEGSASGSGSEQQGAVPASLTVTSSDGTTAFQQKLSSMNSHTTVFSSVPVPNHSSLVFMEPMMGHLASLEQHLSQAAGATSTAPEVGADDVANRGTAQDASGDTITETSTPPAAPTTSKKRTKGKGKARALSQANQDGVPDQQPTADGSAPHTNTGVATSSSAAGPSQVPAVPSYSPPPNGQQPPYPYYIPSPYMTPYGPAPAYPYGYSPPKGSYASPPMYQAPYGSYPYPYPYPGQPYPYPGQPYPPPPGQPYPPPAQAYPIPGDQSQPPAAQPYPPPIQSYAYAHPYPPPPPQPSSSPEKQPIPYSALPTKPSNSDTAGSASTSQEKNPEADPAQKPRTFIVRTSETYEAPVTAWSKPAFSIKRKRNEGSGDGDGSGSGSASPNKRATAEPAGTYSTFWLSMSKTPIPTSNESTADTPDVEAVQMQPQTDTVVENGTQEKTQCSHKTCKRILPSGTIGSLCERCRERLKKKQAKAKHRFKLEPKTLLGRSVGDSNFVAAATA